MGKQNEAKKVKRSIKFGPRPPFGGDLAVDRATGISTENHHEIWRRLAIAGATMHGPPGPPRPRKNQ